MGRTDKAIVPKEKKSFLLGRCNIEMKLDAGDEIGIK